MKAEVRDLFHRLADLPPEARARFWEQHPVDPETRREAEALLAFDSGDSAPLLREIEAVAGMALRSGSAEGARCGPFRLLHVLGRGGMGVVHLAERVDGEVVQRAAVKLLRPGLAGFGRDRFLQERQILAALSHPYIARLLDAGHDSDGQPFMAMEYVEGKPIDQFAETLGLREKLGLYRKVCAAVSYLHRNLVVHRDLKPSNILVTAEGEPKLLDFGIAKMLDWGANPTVTDVRMLTPAFASPEQLAGAPIGIASDIYSLGAVLRVLLESCAPLDRDLEVILQKAMRQEPHERYETVDQFSGDLAAFLESRPVQARKGDWTYRARKHLRRYWVQAAAAALTIGGLAVGLYIANRERAIAQRRFDDVRSLSNKLFEIDRQVRDLPGGTKTRQLIVDTSLEYLRRLAAEARNDPSLALDVGTAYMRVGRVQGVPISVNLGQSETAEANLRIAEDLIRSVLASQPGNRIAKLRAAQIAHDRMVLAEYRRPNTAALPLARESEQWLQKYIAAGTPGPDRDDQQGALIVGINVANWYQEQGLPDEALRLLNQMSGIARQTGQTRLAGSIQINVTRTLRKVGKLEEALAAGREAVRLSKPKPEEKGLGINKRYSMAMVALGEVLGEDAGVSMGRFAEAAACFEEAFQISMQAARQDPNDTDSRFGATIDGIRLAGALRHIDASRGLQVLESILPRLAEIPNSDRARRYEALVLSDSVEPLLRAGNTAEARRRLDTAFARLAAIRMYPAEKVAPGSEPYVALSAQAEWEAASGDVRAGIATYRKLLDKVMATQPAPDASLRDADDLSRIYVGLARLQRKAGQAAEADATLQRHLELWRNWDGKLPRNLFVQRQLALR